MPRKVGPEDDREVPDEPRPRLDKAQSAIRAAHLAHAIQQREEYVLRGLAFLREAGLIDAETEHRLAIRYREGDAAARKAVTDRLARIMGTAPEAIGDEPALRAATGEPGETESLELGQGARSPSASGERIRGVDLGRLLGRSDDPGAVLTFLARAPLAVQRTRRVLLYVGALILLLVAALGATGRLYPAVIPYVGFFGVVFVLLLVAFFALITSRRIHRTANNLGIDLDAYAKLPEDERRILLVRRIGLHALDTARRNDLLERPLAPVPAVDATDPAETTLSARRSASAQGDEPQSLILDAPAHRSATEAGDPEREALPPPVAVDTPPPAAPRPGRMERLLRFSERLLHSAARHADDLETVARRVKRGMDQPTPRSEPGPRAETHTADLEEQMGAATPPPRKRHSPAPKRPIRQAPRKKAAAKRSLGTTSRRTRGAKKSAKKRRQTRS
jgi:hypothetical protein